MSSVERAPNIDPVLSSGAMKLRKRKLDNLPWDHSGRHPGNRIFWRVILLMLKVAWDYIFRRKQIDQLPPFEGGRILSSMHLNGLVDPLAIVFSQDRRIITMGRHDLMTMPLVGWFARRMGSQPVIRRPEIKGGVSNEEYAVAINHRTLLTMTNCIAAGHNAVVMPEGKSHQDSRLHRFKTGPMRFGINAAAIASHRDAPLPALQPVGLHYRRHYWFRTDLYVEFAEPIPIPTPSDLELGRSLIEGKWVEPPSVQVNQLREELFDELSIITPDAPDWQTHRAWHLMGHVRALESGRRLENFREEVLAAREVRGMAVDGRITEATVKVALQAAEILDSNGLDGRSLDAGGIREDRPWLGCLVGLSLMVATAPVVIPSTGLQAAIAWYFGNRTDEGIDARTTYHMLAAMFSPVLFWPPLAICAAYFATGPGFAMLPIAVIAMFIAHLSNLVFLKGYDLWTEFDHSSRRIKLTSSSEYESLLEMLSETRSSLNLL